MDTSDVFLICVGFDCNFFFFFLIIIIKKLFILYLYFKVSPLIIGAVIDAYDDIIVSFVVVGVLGAIFGVALCFSPPFKQHNKENAADGDTQNEETDVNKPLLENEIDNVITDDHSEDSAESQNGDSKTANTDVLDKKTMKPGLFWTITVIVTIFVCMYTGIECTYGGLMATYATEVGVTSSAGAAYMTSCK